MSNPLGIKSVTGTAIRKLEITKKTTISEPLKDSDGSIISGDVRDPVFEISIEGAGDLPDAFLAGSVGDLGVTNVTGGKTIVTSSKQTDNNDKYNDYSAAATNWPSAS